MNNDFFFFFNSLQVLLGVNYFTTYEVLWEG